MPRSPLVLLCLLAAAGAGAAEERKPGQVVLGAREHVEYLVGSLPVVLTAPHGGRDKPADIPDRTQGVVAFDANTQELARAIEAELFARTGRHPHLIICRLSRTKVDCNREIKEAAAGHPVAEQAWRDYHGFVEEARAAAVKSVGKGFIVDLHGHGHKDARLELGYAHRREDYARPDAAMAQPAFVAAGTLALIAGRDPTRYGALLRGPDSLGALYEKAGFAATPSPSKPQPGEPYFDGGYTVRRHAREKEGFAGVQLETNSAGVRDTEASRRKFAAATADVLTAFLEKQLGLALPRTPAAER
jgi:N-formylglutamate amidohydrolase